MADSSGTQKNSTNSSGSFIEKFFKLKENKTTVRTEIIAGITTFVAMAYIIITNPSILSMAGMNSKNLLGAKVMEANLNIYNDPVIGSVFVATILAAIIGTLVMALYANVPFAQAPGMGMNAFFAFYVVGLAGYSWKGALAAVFVCGIINILITVTKVRVMIVDAIPDSLKNAIGAGIGLFIAFIGLKEGGLVAASSATLVQFGNLKDPATLLTLFGLVVTVILMVRKVKGSILLGMVITTAAGLIVQLGLGIDLKIAVPTGILALPPSIAPTFFKMDFTELFTAKVGILAALTIILSFSLVDTFDTIGTFIGTGAKTGIFDEKDNKPKKGMFPKKLDKALFADATATSIGALLGTSNATTYVESTAGISAGGKTGLTSVVTAICFFLALFFSPVISVIPWQATAPALITVGVLMIGSIVRINFEDFSEAVPAFLTLGMMPFTYSISNGIAAGFIFYTLIKVATGKANKVHPIMYVFTLLFLLKFAVGV